MTDYDDILERAVSAGILAYKSATGSPVACGFARIEKIDGRSGLVRHFKSVGTEDNGSFVHPNLPLAISKNSYKGGYDLRLHRIQEFSDGPEFQMVDKKRAMYQTMLETMHERDLATEARVYSRLD